ncbi:hypothetical protein DRW03_03600 [Corallococcus sp. H22C18031201]|uniref:hypothetical protein n=1 Tax=Citreicoccus inhibens TaxID=2849499 RepID=UPI000E7390F1|nr:hypothetical protein [Citreicoccus inhibens]MBU8897683.1 hypothetical protein [Citreicoccus inhibens]RJS27456.1 hypothetical protein DRW03_03600 [Corallococcus sp. H22C18031201]
MRRWAPGLLLSLFVLTACGGAGTPVRPAMNARQALTSAPEAVEFESPGTRLEMFRDIARQSETEAGQSAQGLVLFPISQEGEFVAAPGFDARTDLLQAPDAGGSLQFVFDGRAGDRWSEDRRESLQGLSERESAELVARTLLALWGIHPTGVVQVDRAQGAPYAVAYVDGILRINPSFLYLAAAYGPASLATGNQ